MNEPTETPPLDQAERQRQFLARYAAQQETAKLEAAEAKEKKEHGLTAARQRHLKSSMEISRMFRKSDLLSLGHHHRTKDGRLHVSFDSKAGSSDVLILREVLALFDCEIVSEGTGMDDQQRPVPSQTGYQANLDFAVVAELDFADSFPVLAGHRAKAMQDAIDARDRQREIEEGDHAKRVAAQKARDDLNRARIAGIRC